MKKPKLLPNEKQLLLTEILEQLPYVTEEEACFISGLTATELRRSRIPRRVQNKTFYYETKILIEQRDLYEKG